MDNENIQFKGVNKMIGRTINIIGGIVTGAFSINCFVIGLVTACGSNYYFASADFGIQFFRMFMLGVGFVIGAVTCITSFIFEGK